MDKVYLVRYLERHWRHESDNYYSSYETEWVLNNEGEQPMAYQSRRDAEDALEAAGYIPNPRPENNEDKTWVTYGYSAMENFDWQSDDYPRPLIPVAEIVEIALFGKDRKEGDDE